MGTAMKGGPGKSGSQKYRLDMESYSLKFLDL